MIGEVLNIGNWEWFKLRKRWILWLLLALLLVFSQLSVWGRLYSYRNLKGSGGQVRYGVVHQTGGRISCSDLRAGRLPAALSGADPGYLQTLVNQCDQAATVQQNRLADTYRSLVPPGSVTTTLQQSEVFVVLLATILTASVIGAEYGLGTLRPVLSSGAGRWRFLAGKLLLMVIAAAVWLVVLTLATYLSSLGAKAIESVGPANVQPATWGQAASAFGKDFVSLLPYLAMTAFTTVFAGSTAYGMAIALGYYFSEEVLVAVLSTFGWFQNIANFLLGRAMSGWNGGGPFGSGGISVPGDVQTIIVLAVYGLSFGGLALWLFQNRDIRGASGT